MDVEEVVAAGSSSQLSHGFNEWGTLDVADCASQLYHARIRLFIGIVDWHFRNVSDPVLDGVGQVRYDLDCPAQVIALPLFLYNMLVDLARCDVVVSSQSDV